MKLKQKLPIIVIVSTMLIFLVLPAFNNKDKIFINTIKGNINELSNLNINYEDRNEYIRNIYTLHSGTKTTKKVIPTRYYKDRYGKYFNMINIESKADDIAQVGYSYKNEVYNDIKDIKFVYLENNSDRKSQITQSQGKDIKIPTNKVNKNELKEINVKNKDINVEIRPLASNRYNEEIYIMSNYKSKKRYRYMIEISKLNAKENKLETIKSIDLYKELKNQYFNYDIQIINYSKYEDKFYTLIQATNIDTSTPVTLGKIYLLTYNLSDNTYHIDNILNEEIYIHAEYSEFKEDKLNLIASNFNNSNMKNHIEIIDLDYDIKNSKITSQRKTILEKNIDIKNGRTIDYIVADKNKIYLNIRSYYYYDFDRKERIYVIDRNNKQIIYEGKVVKYKELLLIDSMDLDNNDIGDNYE